MTFSLNTKIPSTQATRTINIAISSIRSDVFTAEVIYHTRVDWERVAARAIRSAMGTSAAETISTLMPGRTYERESQRVITATTQTDIEIQEMRYELTGADALSYMAAHPEVMEPHPNEFELPSRPSEGRGTRVTSEVNPGSQRTQPIHQSQSMQTGYGSFWAGKQKQPTTTLRTELANDNPANLSKKNTSTYTQQKPGMNGQQQRSKVASKTEMAQNSQRSIFDSTLSYLIDDAQTIRFLNPATASRSSNPYIPTAEQEAIQGVYPEALLPIGRIAKFLLFAASEAQIPMGNKSSGVPLVYGENSSRQISSIKRISSDIPNEPFISSTSVKLSEWSPPYPSNISIREMVTAQELKFIRVHNNINSNVGDFFIREKFLKQLNYDPVLIQKYLGLKNVPRYMTDVYIPKNTRLFIGPIGPQPSFGLSTRSGFQYQLAQDIPESSFQNTRLISNLENTYHGPQH